MMNTSLTSGRGFGNSDVPQTKQGVTDAFPVPHTMERAVFFVSSAISLRVYPVGGATY